MQLKYINVGLNIFFFTDTEFLLKHLTISKIIIGEICNCFRWRAEKTCALNVVHLLMHAHLTVYKRHPLEEEQGGDGFDLYVTGKNLMLCSLDPLM